jgi:hypothetical protein
MQEQQQPQPNVPAALQHNAKSAAVLSAMLGTNKKNKKTHVEYNDSSKKKKKNGGGGNLSQHAARLLSRSTVQPPRRGVGAIDAHSFQRHHAPAPAAPQSFDEAFPTLGSK